MIWTIFQHLSQNRSISTDNHQFPVNKSINKPFILNVNILIESQIAIFDRVFQIEETNLCNRFEGKFPLEIYGMQISILYGLLNKDVCIIYRFTNDFSHVNVHRALSIVRNESQNFTHFGWTWHGISWLRTVNQKKSRRNLTGEKWQSVCWLSHRKFLYLLADCH